MKKTAASIAIITALVMIGSGAWPSQNLGSTNSGTLESITIGVPPSVDTIALIYVADEKDFFAANGLNMTLRTMETGVNAVNSLQCGEMDIAVATENPLVAKAFKKEKIQTIGFIDKNDNLRHIGRKDSGIGDVSDLKGKTIGFPQGTILDFFLDRFLYFHGLRMQDVTLVNMNWAQSLDAIMNHNVDAIITYPPNTITASNGLGGNAIIWPVQNAQASYVIMICRDDWTMSNPELVNRLLKSLVQAENYISVHPEEAKVIVQKKMNASREFIDTDWPNNQFSLSLDQSLVLAMEDEARWMISNNLTTETAIPDFRNYIYTKGLMEVNPDAVNIW